MGSSNNYVIELEMQKPLLFTTPLSLRSKFRIGTAVILLVSCIISALLIYYREKALLEEKAYAKTELVMAAVEASREYVREELRPRMYAVSVRIISCWKPCPALMWGGR